MKKISFCIPCYGSENTIEYVIKEIIDVVSQKSEEFDYEIICVNDSSPDNVYSVLKDIAFKQNKVKVINLAKNFGQAGARMATLKYSTGDYIVCLDDDGQCPIPELWRLFEPLQNGYDVSIARYPKKKQSTFKNLGSKFNNFMVHSLMDVNKDFEMSNFFIMKRYLVDEILKYSNPYPYLIGLINRSTHNIAFVGMEERERLQGQTGYTLKKLISLWMNGFTAFSVIPLRISSLIGSIIAVIGFIFGVATVIRKLIVPSISAGWSSLISVILFIGGLIMLMLGMIGEYIGRIYISLNNAPQFVVKETINVLGKGNNGNENQE